MIKLKVKDEIMEYGIYTIQSESEIPKELIEDKYTFYVKINGRDIKDYDFDYMDIMQNAFLFHTKDCVGWRDRYLDWMCDLGWLTCDNGNGMFYKNIILVFEHWNDVGKGWFSSGEKIREKILEDFIEDEGVFESHYERTKEFLEDHDNLQVFNIYLIP